MYVENYAVKYVGNYDGNYVVSYPDFLCHVGFYVPIYMVFNVVSDVDSSKIS